MPARSSGGRRLRFKDEGSRRFIPTPDIAMATITHGSATPAPLMLATVADVLERCEGIPPERIRLHPPPGTATEQDVIDINDRENRLCELIDGVLVEKAVGYYEGQVAFAIAYLIERYLEDHDLGLATGDGAMSRYRPGLVYIPDASFVSWNRLPSRESPREAIPPLVPDLAVEVLSKSNTRKEMDRKLRDYFETGVQVVWEVEPRKRIVDVYRSPADPVTLQEDDELDGGDVLPGFRVKVATIFARADGRRGG
jgi:Uma2 family endonuclease